MDEETLPGGVANAGSVVRVGPHVLRPSTPQTPLLHQLLRHVRAAGFEGVPEPLGIEPDGRERLVFIEGDVPCPPFPRWAQSDQALASIARLLARFHAASSGFEWPRNASWSTELADPSGGAAICHNDVCLENVIFREGTAVALIDFDFVAPGRPLYDLSQMAKMCVPVDTVEDAAVWGWEPADRSNRLRVMADAYGLQDERSGLVDGLEEAMRAGDGFVRRRVERGEPAFIQMWETMGGGARYQRRWEWFQENRDRFLDALE